MLPRGGEESAEQRTRGSELQVFDIFGKMLLYKSIDDREFSVDLSDYSAGTYILRFITDSGVGTHKIVIY